LFGVVVDGVVAVVDGVVAVVVVVADGVVVVAAVEQLKAESVESS
jgi:hypothetical protein